MEFDAFVWLHIASFVNRYTDIVSLCSTCQEFNVLLKPLKKRFLEYHFHTIERKMRQVQKSVSFIYKNSTSNLVNPQLFCGKNDVFHVCKQMQQQYNDAQFVSCLLKLYQEALVTTIDRELRLTEYSKIILPLKITSGIVDEPFNTNSWFYYFQQHCPSVLSWAFQDTKLLENPNNYFSTVTFYLYFKRLHQLPVDQTFLWILDEYGRIKKYFVLKGNLYQVEDYPKFRLKLVCTGEQWCEIENTRMFVIKR